MTLSPILLDAAYRPFIDSAQAILPNLTAYWLWLLLPLVVAIAVVYKTTKVENLWTLPWEATKMSIQIVFYMALVAVALWAATSVAVRYL